MSCSIVNTIRYQSDATQRNATQRNATQRDDLIASAALRLTNQFSEIYHNAMRRVNPTLFQQ